MSEWLRFWDEGVSGESSCIEGGFGYKSVSVGYLGDVMEDRCGYIGHMSQPSRTCVPTELMRRSQLRGKAGQPICMAWRPGGDRLLCGLGNGEVANYCKLTLECEDMKRVLAASGEITKIRALSKLLPTNATAESSSGGGSRNGLLLLGDASGNIHVTTTNLAPVSLISIYTQKDAVLEISPSESQEQAVVGVRTAHPSLLDLATEKPLGIFRGLGFGTSALQYHPHQELVVAGSKTNELQLWDPRDPRSVLTSSYSHKGTVISTEWHPTNDYLFASTSRDHLVHIWDIRMRGVDQWKPLLTCKLDHKPEEQPGETGSGWTGGLSLTANPPGKIDGNQRVCPWCLHRPNAVRRVAHDIAHTYPTCMKWHPRDPSMFVVGDSAGTLSVWRNGACLTQVTHAFADDIVAGWQPEITCLEWNAEGTILSTAVKGNAGGSVCFWTTPPRWTALNPSAANCAHPCHAAF